MSIQKVSQTYGKCTAFWVSRLITGLGSQAIATLTYDEVPPANNPGFFGLDNGMDHNYYLQLAGRYAVRFHEL